MPALILEGCEARALTDGERIGLTFLVMSSLTSIVSIVAIFAGLVHRMLHNLRTPIHLQRPIINSHLDVYVLFLLLADTTRSTWGVLSIPSVLRASVKCGQVCDMQGFLAMLADPAASMLTLAIAVHTFLVIGLRWTPPRGFTIPLIAVALIWGYQVIFLIVLLASRKRSKALFVPLPYWCWLSPDYSQLRLPAVYFWYWLTVGASIALYVPLFFVIRGNLEFGHDYVPRMRSRNTALPADTGGSRLSVASQSKKMLMYPIAYVISLLPFTSSRWAGNFSHKAGINVHLFFFFVSLYFLNGFANVLLLVFTRPSILGFSGAAQHSTADNAPHAGIVSTDMFDTIPGDTGSGSHL